MTSPTWTGFEGAPLAVGDRVLPISWGDGVPLYLCNTPATIVGFGRTRVRLRFDAAAYGGRFPEFDTASPRILRKIA